MVLIDGKAKEEAVEDMKVINILEENGMQIILLMIPV